MAAVSRGNNHVTAKRCSKHTTLVDIQKRAVWSYSHSFRAIYDWHAVCVLRSKIGLQDKRLQGFWSDASGVFLFCFCFHLTTRDQVCPHHDGRILCDMYSPCARMLSVLFTQPRGAKLVLVTTAEYCVICIHHVLGCCRCFSLNHLEPNLSSSRWQLTVQRKPTGCWVCRHCFHSPTGSLGRTSECDFVCATVSVYMYRYLECSPIMQAAAPWLQVCVCFFIFFFLS